MITHSLALFNIVREWIIFDLNFGYYLQLIRFLNFDFLRVLKCELGEQNSPHFHYIYYNFSNFA